MGTLPHPHSTVRAMDGQAGARGTRGNLAAAHKFAEIARETLMRAQPCSESGCRRPANGVGTKARNHRRRREAVACVAVSAGRQPSRRKRTGRREDTEQAVKASEPGQEKDTGPPSAWCSSRRAWWRSRAAAKKSGRMPSSLRMNRASEKRTRMPNRRPIRRPNRASEKSSRREEAPPPC